MNFNKNNMKSNYLFNNPKKAMLIFTITITSLSLIGSNITFGKTTFEGKYSSKNNINNSGSYSERSLTEKAAIDIIHSIDKEYDITITNNNYRVNDRYYYILHSNPIEQDPIEINKNYSDIFQKNGETFFRVHTSYSGIGKYSGYRYCIDKENGEVFLEYVENNNPTGVFIKYSDYIKNMRKFIGILNANNIPLDSHLDVTISSDTYRIHLFSILFRDGFSLTETSGWYDFNVNTGSIIDIINDKPIT